MAVSLQVRLVEAKMTKKIRVPQAQSIGETLKDIREKTAMGGRDHGLFLPALPPKRPNARWLRNDRTLANYDITSDDVVEYRKKHRPLRVKLADETEKTFLIDDSLPVEQILEEICAKMSLPNPEEFSIRVANQKDRWLKPGESMPEQGVVENTPLIFSKRFFATDANVNEEDAIGLHLLYSQCQNMIMTSQFHTTDEEAIQLAALQCQITYGSFDPKKHRSGFLERRLFLPQRLVKDKKVEKKIFKEHAKLVGMTETNAKYRYVQLCRSLKSYGITMFEVEHIFTDEKRKQRVRPMVLGVNRDGILFMNPQTRDVEKEYTLTQLKRWAAAPAEIVLDFGDYEDSYFTLKSKEAQNISQVIGGYIDILLKRRREVAKTMEEDDGTATAIEEKLAVPMGVTQVAVTPGTIAPGIAPGQGVETGISARRQAQMSHIGPKQFEVSDPSAARGAVAQLVQDLDRSPQTPSGGKNLTPSQLGKIREQAVVANRGMQSRLVRLKDLISTGQAPDRQEMLDQIQPLVAHLSSLVYLNQQASESSAKGEEGAPDLGKAAKLVADGLKDLFNSMDTSNLDDLDRAIAATRGATDKCMAKIVNVMADAASREMLEEVEKGAYLATAAFSKYAQNANKGDPAKRKAAIDQLDKARDNLHKVMKEHLHANNILGPNARKRIEDAIDRVQDSVEAVIDSADKDPKIAKKATLVSDGLDLLDAALNSATAEKATRGMPELLHSAQNAGCDVKKIPKQKGEARIATANRAKARTAETFMLAKEVSLDVGPEVRAILLEEGHEAYDHSKELPPIAQASNKDPNKMGQLSKECANVEKALDKMKTAGDREAHAKALDHAIKHACAKVAKLANAIQAKQPKGIDKATMNEARYAAMRVQSGLENVMSNMKSVRAKPYDDKALDSLNYAVDKFLPQAKQLIAKSKGVAAKMPNKPQVKKALKEKINEAEKAVDVLDLAKNDTLKAAMNEKIDKGLDLGNAVSADLDSAILSAKSGDLKKVKDAGAPKDLIAAAKNFHDAVERLAAAKGDQPDKVAKAVNEVAEALEKLGDKANRFAATLPSKEAQVAVLDDAKKLADSANTLMYDAKNLPMNEKRDGMIQKDTAHVKTDLSQLMSNVSKPGAQRVVEDMAKRVKLEKKRLQDANFALNFGEDYNTMMVKVNDCMLKFKDKLGDLWDATFEGENLDGAAREVANALSDLLSGVSNAAGAADEKSRPEMIDSAGNVADQCAALLLLSGEDDIDKQTLLNASKNLSDALAAMMGSMKPGGKDIAQAKERMERALANIKKPPKGTPKRDVMDMLRDSARRLNGNASRFANSAKSNSPEVGDHAMKAAKAADDLVRAGKHIREASAGNDSQNKRYIDRAMKKTLKSVIALMDDASDPTKTADMATRQKELTKGIQELVKTAQKVAPNAEKAMKEMRKVVGDLDGALMSANVGLLDAPSEWSTYNEQDLKRMADDLDKSISGLLVDKATLSQVAPSLDDATKQLDDVAKISMAVAAGYSDKNAQLDLLNASRNLASTLFDLLEALKDPKKAGQVGALQSEVQKAMDQLKTLTNKMESGGGSGDFGDAIAKLKALIGKLDASIPPKKDKKYRFPQHREKGTMLCKNLIYSIPKFIGAVTKRSSDVNGELSSTVQVMTDLVNAVIQLVKDTRPPPIRQKIIAAAKTVTNDLIRIVQNAAKSFEGKSSYDQNLTQKFTSSVSDLLRAISAAAIVDISLDTQVERISKEISKVDTALIFGAEDKGGNANRLGEVFSGIKSLNRHSTNAVAHAKNRNEDLSKSGRATGEHMIKLAEAAGASSASLSQSQQTKLLTAVKNTGTAVQQVLKAAKRLINDTKGNNGDPLDDAKKELNRSIAELAQVAKGASEREERGLSEIGNLIERVKESISKIGKKDPNKTGIETTAEEIVAPARSISSAAHIIADKSSLEDSLKVLNSLVPAVEALIERSNYADSLTQDPKIIDPISRSVKDTALSCLKLLDVVKNNESPKTSAATVKKHAENIISASKKLPGAEQILGDFNNLEEESQRALLNAAKTIQQATAKLASLEQIRPPSRERTEFDIKEDDIAAAILETTRALTKCTNSLVAAATRVQGEITKGASPAEKKSMYADDPMWAKGLISAAQSVATCVQHLVENANQLCKGFEEEEKLIGAARALASHTEKLVAASRAKADPQSKSQHELIQARNTVRQATGKLFNAATMVNELNSAKPAEEEEPEPSQPANQIGGTIAELEQYAKIAALEKQLEAARKGLKNQRKGQYEAARKRAQGNR